MWRRLSDLSKGFSHRFDIFLKTKVLKSKKQIGFWIVIAHIPVFCYYGYTNPQIIAKFSSNNVQKLAQLTIPVSLRSTFYGLYSKVYGVKTQQMTKKFDQYSTFCEFFTRKVKERQMDANQKCIVSPADSQILSFGEITQDSCFVVKGYSYSLGELITDEEITFSKQELNSFKKNKKNKLYHVVLYLAPGDYHRFHSSTNFEVVRNKSIEGRLFSVKQSNLMKRPKVYEKNSRFILHGKWTEGYIGMIFVGALNVGRIVIKDKQKFVKGEEIGYFNLGSTIVLLIESPNLDWRIQQKQKIRYGQPLAQSKAI